MPAELEYWWEKGISLFSLSLTEWNFTSHSGFRLAKGLHMICKPIGPLHFSCIRTFSISVTIFFCHPYVFFSNKKLLSICISK